MASSIPQTSSIGYTVLLDGYNLIMRHPRWKHLGLAASRIQFLHALNTIRWPFPIRQLVVVFDGPEETASVCAARVAVRFCTPSADAYILSTIRSTDHPERLAVISDDGELQQAAKSHCVSAYSSMWFFQKIPPSIMGKEMVTQSLDTFESKDLPASSARQITEELAKRWLGK